jgi:hypothetical protein
MVEKFSLVAIFLAEIGRGGDFLIAKAQENLSKV